MPKILITYDERNGLQLQSEDLTDEQVMQLLQAAMLHQQRNNIVKFAMKPSTDPFDES